MKHPGGRPKAFKTPAALWRAACKYFEYTKANPIYKQQYIRSIGRVVPIPKEVPFSQLGLCLHIGISQDTFRNYLKKPEYKEYYHTARRIRTTIRADQFGGAVVGIYSARIISWELGLYDRRCVEYTRPTPEPDSLEAVEQRLKELRQQHGP